MIVLAPGVARDAARRRVSATARAARVHHGRVVDRARHDDRSRRRKEATDVGARLGRLVQIHHLARVAAIEPLAQPLQARERRRPRATPHRSNPSVRAWAQTAAASSMMSCRLGRPRYRRAASWRKHVRQDPAVRERRQLLRRIDPHVTVNAHATPSSAARMDDDLAARLQRRSRTGEWKTSRPVRPRLDADSPALNSSGSTPMLTRLHPKNTKSILL